MQGRIEGEWLPGSIIFRIINRLAHRLTRCITVDNLREAIIEIQETQWALKNASDVGTVSSLNRHPPAPVNNRRFGEKSR